MLMRGRKDRRVRVFPKIGLALTTLALIGCAANSTTRKSLEEPKATRMEALKVSSPDDRTTIVEIINSDSTPYTTFKLIDPPRVVLDIESVPKSDLPTLMEVNDGNVTDVRLDPAMGGEKTTRMVIALMRELDYEVAEVEDAIRVTLSEKSMPEDSIGPTETKIPEASPATEAAKRMGTETAEPRIFFEPKPSTLNQVLGIDFTLLGLGKSRLSVTTDKRTPYNLDRKTPKTLLLTLEETTIPPLLLRRLDSTHFEGAVDRVTSLYAAADNRLSLAITLRDRVPFHVDQTDSGIYIDFGPTPIKPPEKKIVPVKLQELKRVSAADVGMKQAAPGVPEQVEQSTFIPGLRTKKYTGAPMTMDFVNADVTNILRLIGEISNLNIVWGPEVKGLVSMRLKNVPWDQALDLVLANNDLGMRRQGNVVWVTTKTKIQQIEAEERRKIEEAAARLEAERKRRLAEQEQAKKLEPLVTEYFPIDFGGAEEIKEHIVLSERGAVSVDERTNTIIMEDTAQNIEKAREIVKRFDTPVKQIMIEARIVDASTNFTRDLGVQWFPETSYQQRSDESVVFWEEDLTGTAEIPVGENVGALGFSTNSPESWSPNVTFLLGALTENSFLSLDARLALAENENQAKIISAPKVIASNGKEATISRGDVIIIPATENVESTTLDATLSLNVTPTVSYNNYVTMEVEVTDDRAPTTSRLLQKAISTTLIVKSGDTVVIGGIYKESKGEDEAGVPYLRNIPFLGWLFKAQTRILEKSELLIFLTPRVLSFPTKKT